MTFVPALPKSRNFLMAIDWLLGVTTLWVRLFDGLLSHQHWQLAES